MKKTFLITMIFGCFVAGLTVYSSGFDALSLAYKFFGIILFGATLYLGLIKDADYFSPYSLFAATPFAILIYDEFLSKTFLPMPTGEAVFNIILGQSFFLVGLTVSRATKKRFRLQSSTKTPLRKYSWKILFLIGAFPFVLALALNPFNIAVSAEAIDELRTNFHLPIVSTLSCLMTAALLYVARINKIRIFIVLSLVIILFSFFTQAKGSALILFMTILYAFHYYWNIKYKKTIIFACFLSMLIIVQTYGVIRQGSLDTHEYITSYEYYFSNTDIQYVPKPLQGLYSIYMYMTTPLSNFAYIVENDFESTNGLLTLWPLTSTFQLKRIFEIAQPVKPIRKWPYNTHTFLADFYLDFGAAGVVILSFLLGFVVYKMYMRSLRYNDVLIHAEYLYFGFATFMMFFSNHFTSVAYPLTIFMIFEAFRYLSRFRVLPV